MKLLFLHPNIPDYVGDSLFHGLSECDSVEVLDVPRMDYMYQDYPQSKWLGVANEGKTLYGLLKDTESQSVARKFWLGEINSFDYIIISNPQAWGNNLMNTLTLLKKGKAWNKLIWVDGSDSPAVYPFLHFSNTLKNNLASLLLPMYKWPYFKRENEGSLKMAPGFLHWFTRQYRIFQISISIPKVHIERINFQDKTKDFPGYIVDLEVANQVGEEHGKLGKRKFKFKSEQAYFDDIRNTKFGITTRRAGWDALRHYEYAAKGAILCFRDLDKKHASCAPLDLNKWNCIIYNDFQDLVHQLKSLSFDQLITLQSNGYKWIEQHTTLAEASRFIAVLNHLIQQ